MKKTLLASTVTAGLMVLSFASPAAADPTDLYPAALNGSGSDTTEIVMKALDARIPALGSWDVTGGNWDTNGTAAGCEFTGRNAGSGAGRTSLANSVSNGDGCFQFARSSARSTTANTANQTAIGYTATTPGVAVPLLPITLAVDGLTYVFRKGSGTPRDLTIGQLRGIYNCAFTSEVDTLFLGGQTVPNRPLLPTDLSGTRADWMSLMGLTAGADVASDPGGTLPACIDDGPGDTGIGVGGAPGEFSEHNGNVLTNARMIIPHSIAQYVAQGRSSVGDFRGLAELGYINGQVPLQMYDNPASTLNKDTASGSVVNDGAFFREVYNIVPAANVNDAGITAVFGTRSGGTAATGSDVPNVNSGEICNLDSVLISTGFLPVC